MKEKITDREITSTRLVMIVDDEPDMLSMLKLVLSKECRCEVLTAPSGLSALQLLQNHKPDVIVTDIKMPDLDGLELLKKIRELDSTISVVIMTGYGTIDMAVQALKDGAYDFLQKPFDKDHIVRVVDNCCERTVLLRTNMLLKEQLDELTMPEGFIGQSWHLTRALDLLAKVANTDATVLIRGESGTGKELAAKALHNLSNRNKREMVTVNCPALPEHILESELFGYAKGAFTGALKDKKGLFQVAHGSTILLDEIADIPVTIQTKLLRVLQEKEIQPLGQNRTIKVDVRVVASTNQNLEEKIKKGEFREDLFYRLNVVTVVMPNLQDIEEDIPLLIHHFFNQFKKRYDRPELVISPEALQYLNNFTWQGNVRELKNSVKRLVLLASGNTISLADISSQKNKPPLKADYNFTTLLDQPYNQAKGDLISAFSVQYIRNVLKSTQGNVTNAAAKCGMERQALQRLMRKHSIISSDFKIKS